MIETVLALPFLLVIFALVIFFGFTMVRLQKAASVDRYEAWRAQAYAPGPHAPPVSTQGGVVDRYDSRELRDAFYATDRIDSLGVQTDAAFPGGADAAADLLAAAARENLDGLVSNRMQDLPEALLLDEATGLPRSRVLRLSAEHGANSAFERQFDQGMTHRFGRADGDWRYINDVLDLPNELWFDRRSGGVDLLYGGQGRPRRVIAPSIAVRDLAMSGLDGALAPLSGVNPVAEMIRNFYLRVPGYRGPKLPTTWERGQGDDGFGYDPLPE